MTIVGGRPHPADRVAGLMIAHGPSRLRFFTGGWGDPSGLAHLSGLRDLPDPEPLVPDYGPGRRDGDLILRSGTFPSPVAELPPAARTGHVLEVMPEAGTEEICVLMPAWNDHGYRSRLTLARPLARRGIGSIILENPYYGDRRPFPEGQPIQTVADFAVMGLGAVTEARGLLAGTAGRTGVAGFSMGGNLAALVAATMPGPLAVAPLAASHSPGPVYLDGVLRGGIAWEALTGVDDPEVRLRSLLSAVSALDLPAPPHTGRAVLVAASGDGFVSIEATRALHRHWPGSVLWEVPGGHATLWYLGRPTLVDAVVAAFARAYAG